ncbi:MAG: hypothetical protein IIB38_16700 [Candidatus Hydrogenedentes bacterium]|nr:hypothetical protein [Candidatus Hydrogenedentota bacterium]
METRKVATNYPYEGLGFPIVFEKVSLARVGKRWVPDIDYDAIIPVVLDTLARFPFYLTGNQIRFIRLHYDMTLKAFAERFGVRHSAVVRWEKRENKSTSMGWGTEKDIRLFVLGNLNIDPKDFMATYEGLAAVPVKRDEPLILPSDVGLGGLLTQPV